MAACVEDGCGNVTVARDRCAKHYRRWAEANRSLIKKIRPKGTGGYNAAGYFWSRADNKYGHQMVAEKALGKPLPAGAVVHHVNGDKGDNRPENLVICPSANYHYLIHAREKALDACGDANKRRCVICGEYDSVDAMYLNKANRTHHHKVCWNARARERKAAKRIAAMEDMGRALTALIGRQ